MLPTTFRRIEVFMAAVESGSFVAAADRLGVAPACVSDHVRLLERQMGCALFIRRRGRSSLLSEQGRRLYRRGQALMEQVRLINEELSPNRPPGRKGRMIISAQRFLATFFLAEPVSVFASAHDRVEVLVETGDFEQVMGQVGEGRADLGYVLAYRGDVDLPSVVVGHEALGFFCAPDHPLAAEEVVSSGMLESFPFIGTRRDRRFGRMISDAMAAIGVLDTSLTSQIQDGALIGEMASRGLGVMCGMKRAAIDLLTGGKLVELTTAEPLPDLEIHQIMAPGRRPSESARIFAASLS
jgi:DNA-binding transcriptional LysR family regulator